MSLSGHELRVLDELAEALARSDPRLARVLGEQPPRWRGLGRLRSDSGGEGLARPVAHIGRLWVRWIAAVLVAASMSFMLCGVVMAQTLLIDIGLVTMMCCPFLLVGARPRRP